MPKYIPIYLEGKQQRTIDQVEELIIYLFSTLIRRKNFKNRYRCVFTPLNPNVYAPNTLESISHLQKYSRKTVRTAIEILDSENMIYVDWGRYSFLEYEDDTGKKYQEKISSKVTTIRLKDMDRWRGEDFSTTDNIDLVFYNPNKEYGHPAILRKKLRKKNKKRRKKDNKLITTYKTTYEETPIHDPKILNDLNYINKQMPWGYKYTRIFGEDLNTYGRYFADFQFMSKKYRTLWKRDRGLVEVDFSAFNPNLLHLILYGTKFKYDPYLKICKLLKIDSGYRNMFKKLSLSLIGSKDKNSCMKSLRNTLVDDFGVYIKNPSYDKILIEEALETDKISEIDYKRCKATFQEGIIQYGLKPNIPQYLFNFDYILKAIEQAFEPILSLLYTNITTLAQNLESDTCTLIMKEMINCKIKPYTIHDSFLVPENHKEYFEDFIEVALYKTIIKNRKKLNLPDDILFLLEEKLNSIYKNSNFSSILLINKEKIKEKIKKEIYYHIITKSEEEKNKPRNKGDT